MLTIENIKKEFENRPEAAYSGVYSELCKFENQKGIIELSILASNQKTIHIQLEKLTDFLLHRDEIKQQVEKYRLHAVKNNEQYINSAAVIGDFDFEVITVLKENSGYDIELIGSKRTKKLFWRKNIYYAIFIKDLKVVEVIELGV